MARTKLGVVVPLGGAGEFDELGGWGPAPLLLGGRILLYYTGQADSTWRIGLAVSDDGVHFTKLGVVVPLGGAGDFDQDNVYDPAPLLLDGRILLYYTGQVGSTYRIGLAASDDGVHFTKLGVVLPLGALGDFDSKQTYASAPLLLDGRILLYYTGQADSTWCIGLAASDDGVHFTKLGVVVPLGGAGDFDQDNVYDPAPLLLDGRILLYYTGQVGLTYRIGLAASDDGVHFTKLGVVVPLGGVGEFDSTNARGSAPLLLDGRILLYYTGNDAQTWRVGLAASDEGI